MAVTKTYPILDDTGKRIAAALETMAGNVSPIYDHVLDGAGPHNNFYRGSNLGGSITSAQSAALKAGTFKGMFIGDYWQVGSTIYRIAAFDYYYQTGDTACTTHHAVLVPDAPLYAHRMNETTTTNGGYANSEMFTSGLDNAKTTINSAFSGHVLEHRKYLINASTNGFGTGGAWATVTVDLMTEEQVYGTNILSARSGNGVFAYTHTVDKTQMPLFRFRPDMQTCRSSAYWLQNICSPAYFAHASARGIADAPGASSAFGVRPAFCVS